MGPILVRPAVAEDAAAIAEIHLSARREAMPYLPTLHTDDEVRAYFAGVVLPGGTVWAAEDGGRVVGFAALRDESLDHLYVLPGQQRRGVGSALLARAKEAKPDGFGLYVFQRNTAAQGFYEARGFVAVAFGDGSGNEEGEPDARYAWTPTRIGPTSPGDVAEPVRRSGGAAGAARR